MRRSLTAGLALGFGLLGGLVGVADGAGASGYSRSCEHCAAAGTTRVYKTIHPVLHVTRYYDRAVYHHVTRLHYVVDVTRVQPIVYVHNITRLHHFTILRDAYAYPPQPPVSTPYVQQIPAYASGCGCMD